MKSFIISLFLLSFVSLSYAENYPVNESENISVEMNENMPGTPAVMANVNITVPIPTQYSGGALNIRNTATGSTYSLSNGNAYYKELIYSVPTGTYIVQSISVGGCNKTPKAYLTTSGVMEHLVVGTTFTISQAGTVTFTCMNI